MSKREHQGQPKPDKLPQIELTHNLRTRSVSRSNQSENQAKAVKRKRRKNPFWKLFLTLRNKTLTTLVLLTLFLLSDTAALQAFSPRFDAHNFYVIHVLFFTLCSLIFSEYLVWLTQTAGALSWPPEEHRYHISRSALQNWMVGAGRILWRIYGAVLALHLVSWVIATANHQGPLEFSIFVTAFEAIVLGIGLHMMFIVMRSFLWDCLDYWTTKRKKAEYRVDDEVDFVIVNDRNYDYVLEDDGEVEKVKHDER